MLDALPLQVVVIGLGSHGGVGVDVFTGGDETHGEGPAGEGLDVAGHGAQADQRRLAEASLEQLGGQRATAAGGKLGQHLVTDLDLLAGDALMGIGVIVDDGHSCKFSKTGFIRSVTQ
ncbi:hypothetical protein D3C72_1064510 [compost metagenome]